MAQTIKRKAKGARRQAAAQGKAHKVRKAKAQTGTLVDALLRVLPFTEEQLHRVFLAMILGGGVALAWFVASLAGVPAMASQQVALLASDAGFVVRKVEVRGVQRMNELKVYNIAYPPRGQEAMPLVDLAAVREDLLQLAWVKDARVSRRLPDSLVVDIVERQPYAVLDKPGRLVLIDVTGHELEPISAANAKGKLLLKGPGVSKQAGTLDRLLDSAPALRPRVAAAEWVGNRRWNVTFETGQVLALPQGDDASAKALVEFARLDGVNRLLGGKVANFDMRAPGRIYMRIPGRTDPQALPAAAASASPPAGEAIE
jgi:cell division protein FtsQ